ncbi:MAG: OmpA family protein [Bacteroidota bacterium]
MRKLIIIGLALLSLLVGLLSSSYSQTTVGRVSIGLHGGVNTFINDFNKRRIGPGGEVMLRYGVTTGFSLGLQAGYEELKAKQEPDLGLVPYDYVKLHAFPATITAWFHLLPGGRVSPYIYFGGGFLLFKRLDGNKNYVPEDKMETSILIPVGVGLETHISRRASIVVDLGFRLGDDKLDGFEYKRSDSYATAKAGFNFYLGSSGLDDDDEDGLTNAEEQRLGTNPKAPDSDGDGLKDGEEIKRYSTNPLRNDTEEDGLSDGDEVMKHKTDPAKSDTDADGLLDGEETLQHRTDPLKLDSDGDGLTDGDEVLKHSTSPLKLDTDDDGLSDWDEVKTFRSDPNKIDTDGDGLTDGDEVRKHRTDPAKVDTDGGGVTDGAEITRKSNPLNPKDDTLERAIILERGKSVVLDGVTFKSGSATLTKESEVTLEKAFIALVANPDINIEIAGYTDNTGSKDTNDRLSLNRAQSVKTWLVRKGISARRMTTVGMGIRDPIAENATPEGRSQNRRIEFHVLK